MWSWIGGVFLGAIATTALVVSQLTKIANGIQYFFPEFGPFDASIAIASPFVKGEPKLIQNSGSNSEPAVEVHVEFIESSTGHSKLDHCYSDLLLGQNEYPSTSQPVQLPSNSQQVVETTFLIPEKQYYAGQALLRGQCIKRVATPVAFNLPIIKQLSPPQRQQTTYVVCIGEYQRACGGNATWLPCGADPSGWAKTAHPAECQKVTARTLSDVSGNHCGYATVQITCSE